MVVFLFNVMATTGCITYFNTLPMHDVLRFFADRDKNFESGHVGVAADVGNLDFLRRHVVTPRGAGRAPGRPWMSGVGPLLPRPGVESPRLRRCGALCLRWRRWPTAPAARAPACRPPAMHAPGRRQAAAGARPVLLRSEARRGGRECVSPFKYRWE